MMGKKLPIRYLGLPINGPRGRGGGGGAPPCPSRQGPQGKPGAPEGGARSAGSDRRFRRMPIPSGMAQGRLGGPALGGAEGSCGGPATAAPTALAVQRTCD